MGGVTSIAQARSQKKSDPLEAHIEKLLGDARTKLIETGARNRLIHTPRGGKRSRCLPIVSAKPDSMFVALMREGRQLRFLPASGDGEGRPARAEPEAGGRGGHLARNGLQTTLASESLHRRLQTIHRDARTAEEERGANILFLALGFLRWYEDERSDALRQSPLVLLPVALARDARRSTFDLVFRDDDIAANQALQERMRNDFAISLPDIPETDNWLPSQYFSQTAAAIAAKRRWSIDAAAAELGFFSSSKLMIMRDLDPASWPGGGLIRHPLVRGLLREGFTSEPPIVAEDARLDDLFAPEDLTHVVDADSSQTRVIESVRKGRNLIVQGPPGTGKSQTITNIIAGAARDGKSVLFVAEKMAALNVVHDRLKQAGLEALCLELHSHTANRRLVADRLDATLQSADHDVEDHAAASELRRVRDALNVVADRLHHPVAATGMTAYQALSIQIAAGARQITPDAPLVAAAAEWTREDYDAKMQALDRLARLTASAGPLNRHVYFGVRQTSLQPADFQRIAPQLRRLSQDAAALAATASGVARFLGIGLGPTLLGVKTLIALLRVIGSLPQDGLAAAEAIAASGSVERIIEATAKGLEWRRRRERYTESFDAAIWRTPLARLRPAIAQAASFWSARLGLPYRESDRILRGLAIAPLPQGPAARLSLIDSLIRCQELSQSLATDSVEVRRLIGAVWRGGDTDFALLHTVAQSLRDLSGFDRDLKLERVIDFARKGVATAFADDFETSLNALAPLVLAVVQALDVDTAAAFRARAIGAVDLERLAERAAQWTLHPARFEEWGRLAAADQRLRALGLPAFADALARGALAPARACAGVEAAFAEATWRRAMAADKELAAFDGERHDALIETFRALEARARRAAAASVRARHQAGLPLGALGAMGVIRGEIGRKRNHMPLRKLIRMTGETIQKIKPVFLMSPLSVAQYLPPGAVEFDLLVIDEASQVRPGDALGVIARCRQMVIVGDKKQLPPTHFFDRMLADEADGAEDEEVGEFGAVSLAPVSDLESILSLCEARGVESQMLRWHYRSRHPSLIQVSNAEFYHRLVMPPAPVGARSGRGLTLRRVAGAYDRGGLRNNLVEAEAIAAACAEHARASLQVSLGVVTLSSAQRDLISERLEARRRDDPLLDAFLRERGKEDAFIKNIENVQGDERDVILISIGYGPRVPGGPIERMAFGPISSEGGERRLNVLFTRARLRCEVFASFGSGDINLERATGAGPRVLKRFLRFAETGVIEEPTPTGRGFDSPFEANVADAIEAMGFAVELQIGSAGFRIDLAVRDLADPGRFMLGIECDGATYHSALWARERDRLRQEVLEGLGWRIYRVWSTDWFYRREEQLRKLKAALDAACKEREPAADAPPAARQDESSPAAASARRKPARARSGAGLRRTRNYLLAERGAWRATEAASLDPARLEAILRSVIEQEGPIREDEIGRRIASFFDRARLSVDAAAALRAAFDRLAKKSGGLRREGDFWLTEVQRRFPSARCRAQAPPRLRKLEMIAPSELQAAVEIALAQVEPGTSDLAGLVAHILGLPKRARELRQRVHDLARKVGAPVETAAAS